jgi:DNA-binding GntR family transcriptional regulator
MSARTPAAPPPATTGIARPRTRRAPRPPSLSEQARAQLEEMVVTLQLEPGSLWSEGELATLTGMGRTPVREALKRLEAEHLVCIVQRHGVQITEIDPVQQLYMLETRRELERLAARQAARRRSVEQARLFVELAARIRSAGRDGDVVAFMRLHRQAVAVILGAADNRFLAAALSPFHALSRRFYFQHHRHARDLVRACNHHAAVLRATAAGDSERAAKAADAVLDYVERLTRATLSGPR